MLEKIKKLKVNIGWRSIVLIAVCAALIFVDLITKHFEEKDTWSFTVIPKLIEVTGGEAMRNPGCAFGFLAKTSWGRPLLIVVTFILLAILIPSFIFVPERFTLLKVALSMIIAGAIGNLVDRLMLHGEVRDFIDVLNWFCCNFADVWVTFGAAIAIVDILFINEWAIFPLTEKAKVAQREHSQAEQQQGQENEDTDSGEINEQ